jgi:hypothetical protein
VVRRVDVTVLDDIDGSVAHETIVFGYDGTWFEIDLSEDNAARVHGLLTEWSGRGRPAAKQSSGRRRTAADRANSAAIRTWARGQGFEVSDRGRLADHVVAAYQTRTHSPKREVLLTSD